MNQIWVVEKHLKDIGMPEEQVQFLIKGFSVDPTGGDMNTQRKLDNIANSTATTMTKSDLLEFQARINFHFRRIYFLFGSIFLLSIIDSIKKIFFN